MSLSRRDVVRYGAVGAGAMLSGCAPLARQFIQKPDPLPPPRGPIGYEWRLLNRAGFGPRPGDVARARADGPHATIERLIAASEPEQLGLTLQLSRLDSLTIKDPELRDLSSEEIIRQIQQAAILRAVYGTNPLQERLTDLWSNHFNINARKTDSAYRKGAEESSAIRAHALGSFPELLSAVAFSPAMIAFLDNQLNLKRHPNENFARELMELHSLGVDGGYTQRDVQEVARCFTGWTIENRFLHRRGEVVFMPELHDDGPKTVLGHSIASGGGEEDAKQVVTLLASHPAAAHFIAKKLVAWIVGSADSKLVATTERSYLQTKGDIRSMVRPLLAPEVLNLAPPVLKRPFEFAVSSIHASSGDSDGGPAIQQQLQKMGEPLYQWPMPDGYPTRAGAWAANVLPRWNFAYLFANGSIQGTGPDLTRCSAETVLQRSAGQSKPELLKAIAGETLETGLALMLSDPEFHWC